MEELRKLGFDKESLARRTRAHAPVRTHRCHRAPPLERGGHPARQLQLRQQRVLPAGHGPGLPAPRLQPLPGRQGRDHRRPAHPRRQAARAHPAGFLPEGRHAAASRGPLRPPGRPARRRGSREGDHRGDGVHRGGLREPARRPAQGRVPGAGQRRPRPAPAHPRPRGAEAGHRRRLRPHLRILPDPVRGPEGP